MVFLKGNPNNPSKKQVSWDKVKRKSLGDGTGLTSKLFLPK